MRIEAVKDTRGYKLLSVSRPDTNGKTRRTNITFADYKIKTGELRIFNVSGYDSFQFPTFGEAVKHLFTL